jgi:S-adenosylmethionine:diacylglycerol 3-amino-3-carboxypropyl transferase
MNKPLTEEQKHQVEALVPYIARIVRARARSPQERDDFLGAAYLAACVAVRSWRPKGGESLKTWIGRAVQRDIRLERCFHAVPVGNGRVSGISRAESAEGSYEGRHRRFIDTVTAQQPENVELLDLSVYLGPDTPPGEVDILKKVFLDELTLAEIGRKKDLTRQRIHQVVDAALHRAAERGENKTEEQ